MKLGYSTGYWGSGPPAGAARVDQGSGAPRVRLGVDGRGLRLRRAHARSPGGARTRRTIKLGTRIVQMSARTPTATGDGRDDARPPLRRPVHPRPRRVGPAGRRGLVRPAVSASRSRAPASTSTIVAPDRRPRGAGRVRRRALRDALPRRHRPRQAAQVDRSTRCAPTSRSTSAPRARRTSRSPPRSPTAGSRSSTRRKRRRFYRRRARPRGSPRPGARRTADDFEVACDDADHRRRRRRGGAPT